MIQLSNDLQDSCSSIVLWAKVIHAEQKDGFDMISEKGPYIKSAHDQLQAISQDKLKRMEDETREKATRDHGQFLLVVEQRGIQRICTLQNLLLKDGRYNDLSRFSQNEGYRSKLF